MDNPSVVAVEDEVVAADTLPVVENVPEDVSTKADQAPVPEVIPKTVTQVIIAQTQVIAASRPLVERKQEPPKTITKLPNGTIKQDW